MSNILNMNLVKSAVNTGDNSNLTIPLLLCLVAVVLVIVAIILGVMSKKKKKTAAEQGSEATTKDAANVQDGPSNDKPETGDDK